MVPDGSTKGKPRIETLLCSTAGGAVAVALGGRRLPKHPRQESSYKAHEGIIASVAPVAFRGVLNRTISVKRSTGSRWRRSELRDDAYIAHERGVSVLFGVGGRVAVRGRDGGALHGAVSVKRGTGSGHHMRAPSTAQ